MVYLVVSIISAMAIAVSVYVESASVLLAFAAYSLTGTLVLSSVLVSAYFELRKEDDSAASDA